MKISKIKEALIKAAVVLVPTYTMAYLTDKMIYVVPMLAASAYVAAGLFGDIATRKVDDDDNSAEDNVEEQDAHDYHEIDVE